MLLTENYIWLPWQEACSHAIGTGPYLFAAPAQGGLEPRSLGQSFVSGVPIDGLHFQNTTTRCGFYLPTMRMIDTEQDIDLSVDVYLSSNISIGQDLTATISYLELNKGYSGTSLSSIDTDLTSNILSISIDANMWKQRFVEVQGCTIPGGTIQNNLSGLVLKVKFAGSLINVTPIYSLFMGLSLVFAGVEK